MDSAIRRQFLWWLSYDLYCAEHYPYQLELDKEFWGIWMPQEIKLNHEL